MSHSLLSLKGKALLWNIITQSRKSILPLENSMIKEIV